MTRSAFIAALFLCVLLAPAQARGCLPAAWIVDGGPRRTAEGYAQTLMTHGSAVVYAKVIAVNTERSGTYARVDRAKIQVIERFKGPQEIEEIYTYVYSGTCNNLEFSKGEERLFVLGEVQDAAGVRRLYEVHSWRHPLSGVPFLEEAALLSELRKLGPRSMQPNSTLHADAREQARARR